MHNVHILYGLFHLNNIHTQNYGELREQKSAVAVAATSQMLLIIKWGGGEGSTIIKSQ